MNLTVNQKTMQKIIQLLKQSFTAWQEDQASRLAAALAYYTIFSLAPLLLILIAVVGFIWGQAGVRTQIIMQAQAMLGDSGAKLIQNLLEATNRSGGGVLASLIGAVTLILGAIGVFGELQSSLNFIWKIEPEPSQGIAATLKNVLIDRLSSFGLILGIGLLLLISLVASTVIGGLAIPSLALQALDFLISSALMTLLFAMIYKILPDAEIAWQDVWLGAGVTAILFTIGKYLVGLYLGNSATSSAFGAAGSLALLLLWIYYSAQIIFLGAEFTRVYANQFGSKILPDETAELSATESASQDQTLRPGRVVEQRYRELRKGAPAGLDTTNTTASRPILIVFGMILASFIAGILVDFRKSESN